MDDLHVYEVDDGEQHWYVAESKGDAIAQHLEAIGEWPDGEPGTAVQIPDDRVLTIDCDGDKQTMLAREWASAKGCIGSTCY